MFAEGQFDAFTSLIWKFVLCGIFLGVVGVPLGALLGRQLITILYRPEYATYLNIFLVMIATTSVVAVASFLGYGVTAARSFKMPVLVVGISVVATAIFSFLLVPKFGLLGATLALLIASVVQAVGLALLMNSEICRARQRAYPSIARGSSHDVKQTPGILSKGTL
jgi:O-antigen/teichoic acid export membrane protein